MGAEYTAPGRLRVCIARLWTLFERQSGDNRIPDVINVTLYTLPGWTGIPERSRLKPDPRRTPWWIMPVRIIPWAPVISVFMRSGGGWEEQTVSLYENFHYWLKSHGYWRIGISIGYWV
jgi:hypothetical protein